MLLNNLKKMCHIGLVIILIMSVIQIIPIDPIKILNEVSAGSNLKDTTEADFNAGTLNNVVATSNGNVKLALQTKYIEDDFNDETKISFKKNVIVDTVTGEAKLLKIVKTYGGSEEDNGFSIRQTSDGGFIISGSTESYGAGDIDVWLIKTDSYGNKQWDNTFGGSNIDWANSVLQTSDGGYIIGGCTWSYGAGLSDVWLIKTDSSGNYQWDKTFGGSDYDWGREVQQTSDSGYIITGGTYSYGAGYIDVWLIKTDSSGNKQWDKTFGGSDLDEGSSVQQTSDNGYIIVGFSDSYGVGDIDALLIKTDSSGDFQWGWAYPGGSDNDYCYSVKQTSDNGYIMVGTTWYNGAGENDLWLIKIDALGNKQWDKTFGGSNSDYGRSIELTSDSGYIISGATQSYGAGGYDSWLIKTDALGNQQWDKTFGGSNNDDSESVQQTSDGGYIITGQTETFGTGLGDTWLIKTDSSGNVEFTNGELISVNLLSGQNAALINSFNYDVSIPSGTGLKVQFSQDNLNWYDSKGVLNNLDILVNGANPIDLSTLNWKGSDFYYKINLTSNLLLSVPIVKNINVSYSQYFSQGTLISHSLDSGNTDIKWKTLTWTATNPDDTNLKFQLRAAGATTSLSTKDFVGPDGTTGSYYTSSGSNIWSGHNNNRYIQYKAYLSSLGNNTPILEDITIKINSIPDMPILIAPENDVWINDNTVKFSWIFIDSDGTQNGFQVLIDNNEGFGSINYNSGEQSSSNQYWQFPMGTSYLKINEGILYWKVRTQDNNDDWGSYCNYWTLKIDTTEPESFQPTVDPDGWTTEDRPTITFSTTDETSGIDHYEIKIDSGDFTKQSSPYNLPTQDDGIHEITIRAYDLAGNYRDEDIEVSIDTTPPKEFVPTMEPSGWSSNNQPKISFYTTDKTSGIDDYKVKIDEGNFVSQYSPYTMPPQTDGIHTVTVSAFDLAGNYREVTLDVYIDTTKPEEFRPVVTPSNWTSNNQPEISFSTNDSHSGIDHYEVKIDNGKFSEQSSPYTLPLKADGIHTVTVRAYDRAGNFRDASIKCKIDIVPPKIYHQSITNVKEGEEIIITATVTDEHSGVGDVFVYYKQKDEATYSLILMVGIEDTYSATIPAETVTSDIEYYIKASDRATPPNSIYFGSLNEIGAEPTSTNDIDITVESTGEDNKDASLWLWVIIIIIIIIILIILFLFVLRKRARQNAIVNQINPESSYTESPPHAGPVIAARRVTRPHTTQDEYSNQPPETSSNGQETSSLQRPVRSPRLPPRIKRSH